MALALKSKTPSLNEEQVSDNRNRRGSGRVLFPPEPRLSVVLGPVPVPNSLKSTGCSVLWGMEALFRGKKKTRRGGLGDGQGWGSDPGPGGQRW